jgi:hypothetical protein
LSPQLVAIKDQLGDKPLWCSTSISKNPYQV